MEINNVNTTDQDADLLTKQMTTTRHVELTCKLNLYSRSNLTLRGDERISTDVFGSKQSTCQDQNISPTNQKPKLKPPTSSPSICHHLK